VVWKKELLKPSPQCRGCSRSWRKIREQGYAVDDEENNLGARCLGAPVFNDRGSIEAALGLSGTTQQVSPQTMPRILEALKDGSSAYLHGHGLPGAPSPLRASGMANLVSESEFRVSEGSGY